MGMHCGGSGPITPIPTKPVPRPLGSSSLFSSPLHSLLYRHPYLAAGGWTTTVDARFNFMSTFSKKYIWAFGLSINDFTAWGGFKGFVRSVNKLKSVNIMGELHKIVKRHFSTTPFSNGPVIKEFIQLQVPNYQFPHTHW